MICPNCWQPNLETESINKSTVIHYCQFCGETTETTIQPNLEVISPDSWSSIIEPAYSSLT